jgi:divinyl protochlorophyllide a 8-vinyl-reductase
MGHHSAAHDDRIGPNAVIRLGEALLAVEGAQARTRLFEACGLGCHLVSPPQQMVETRDVRALYRTLHRVFGDRRARSIGWIAGQRTADYLLTNRIPRAAQRMIRVLPARLGARLLAQAIARNAWTFLGDGTLSVAFGPGTNFSIADCALCRGAVSPLPYCDYYAATFERLFACLVHPAAQAVETHCRARGDAACRFAVSW